MPAPNNSQLYVPPLGSPSREPFEPDLDLNTAEPDFDDLEPYVQIAREKNSVDGEDFCLLSRRPRLY